MSKQLIMGWFLALFGSIVIGPLSKVFIAYSGQIMQVNTFVYVCVAFNMSALILLLYAGYGKLSQETMRSVQTWGYGLVTICLYIIAFMLFTEAGATEGSFLQRSSVVFTVLAAWLFFGRKQSFLKVIGLVIIAISLTLMILNNNIDKIFYIFSLVGLWGLCHTIRIFIAEMHQTHSKAVELQDAKSRARVIGIVMFVVGMGFTFCLLCVAALNTFYADSNLGGNIPNLNDFLNPQTILLGMFLGAFFVTVNAIIEFTTSNAIKSENVQAISCLSPLLTLFWEWSTSPLTGLDLNLFNKEDFILGIIITLGGFIMIIASVKKKDKNDEFKEYIKYSAQDLEAVEETREIIANSLEHFNSNLKQTSKALNIPVKVLNAILEDKEKLLAFKADILSQVAKSYRKNVATADALTGLLNKGGFMTALKAASFESNQLSLYFIDLNKFKPVNDTYGHEAGDFVLKIVAERLKELFPTKSLITRLGGDEYCILLLEVTKEQAEEKIEIISQDLEQEIEYNEHKIIISGSIGLAHYPTDTKNAEKLIKLADKQMYVKKEGR
jgi:diguanylate cyclase (GGDEF)-like protein